MHHCRERDITTTRIYNTIRACGTSAYDRRGRRSHMLSAGGRPLGAASGRRGRSAHVKCLHLMRFYKLRVVMFWLERASDGPRRGIRIETNYTVRCLIKKLYREHPKK